MRRNIILMVGGNTETGGNTIGDSVMAGHNTGGGHLINNSAHGRCILTANSPGIDGSDNTTGPHKTNTCNRVD